MGSKIMALMAVPGQRTHLGSVISEGASSICVQQIVVSGTERKGKEILW